MSGINEPQARQQLVKDCAQAGQQLVRDCAQARQQLVRDCVWELNRPRG